MKIENLNQFKKYLQVGTKLKSKYTAGQKGSNGEVIERVVTKKQTNAIKFDNGSWLYLESAKDFNFTDNKIELLSGDEVVAEYYI